MEPASTRRLVLIGPILPFRGGIAQHTTMLHRALPDLAECLTISFVRQYPALIFPGKSDRDPDYEGYKEPGVEYLIDSLNPLTWIRAVKRVLSFRADTVVFPWWTVYWAPCWGFIAEALRRKGVKVVFFCHNVIEHESAKWRVMLTRWVLRKGSSFVAHTKEDAENLQRLLPGATVCVHQHPIYDQFPRSDSSPSQREGIELLFYGFVRPYKGLDVLIEAMAKTPDHVHLTVAGEFWSGEEEARQKIAQLGLSHRIALSPRYHTDQETAALFEQCDYVVLPYRSATGSGVVPVAYHYNKPVVATRVGGLPDVVDDGITGWLVQSDNPAELADVLSSLKRSDSLNMAPAIQAKKDTMTWKSLAATFFG